jgi:hypothetical protein
MPNPDAALLTLVQAIVADDAATVANLLAKNPALASAQFAEGATRKTATAYFINAIGRYIMAGDTALHVAAGACRKENRANAARGECRRSREEPPRRRPAAQEQERLDADAARRIDHRPRRQRLAAGQSAAGGDRASARGIQ